MRRAVMTAISLSLTAGLSIAAAVPAAASPTADHLNRGDTMFAGDMIENPAGAHLTMQSDGNLVEYNQRGNVCWASGTKGSGAWRATFQNDGNFVVYASVDDSRPVWASHTTGVDGINLNINASGQIWVGYAQLTGNCD